TTMRTKQTFSTLFWLQTTRAINNEALIYIRITVDGKRVNLSLKRRMPIDLWDSSKKRAKGTSALSRQFNQYLEEVHSQIFQIYQDLKYKGELITAALVKAHYAGGTQDQGKSLLEIIDYHNKKIEN